MSTENSPLVFIKDDQAASFTIDLSSFLLTNELPLTATVGAIQPVTSPALVFGTPVIPTGDTHIIVPANNGLLDTTYGVQLTFTTNQARTVNITLAVLVKLDLNVPYATKNPYAFQSLIDSIQAGDAAIGMAFFHLPASINVSQGYIRWSLLDGNGTVYSTGNAYDYRVVTSSMGNTVTANSVINVPSDTPSTLQGQRYQIRWELYPDPTNTASVQFAFEGISVLDPQSVPVGPDCPVELYGDIAQPGIVVERVWNNIGIQLFKGNTQVLAYTPVTAKARVAGGWYYNAQIDTTPYAASLEPYAISWSYKDTVGPTNRETGRLYIVNASILNAIEDVRQLVMKARTTLLGFPDAMFDTVTIISWLRRAMDLFNAASGMITSFDMTNASGGVREYWLGYAEVSMLRAQYLAEGEKAFDFQGQAIQLSTDKTQYYQQLADTIQQRLDNEMKPFKTNLKIMGVTSGDGNVDGATATFGSMGCVGIGLNAVSPAYGYFGRRW